MDVLLQRSGRSPQAVRRSMMTGVLFGCSRAELEEKASARGRTVDELRGRGVVVGGVSEVRDQLQTLAGTGLQRIMLQWLDLDDTAGLEALANAALT